MGLDLSTIATRLDSASVRRIRQDAGACEVAELNPPFSYYAVDEPQPDISRELLADLPDELAHSWFYPFPDRSYQQAEYLIDPAGRRALTSWVERERSLNYRIIHGDEPFADHAVADQGHPLRCSTTAFLTEAAARIDAIDDDAARREFSVARMYADGAYKARPDEYDSVAFDRITGRLRTLATYYHKIVDQGLDLIVKLS
jgi:hypothetical protein